MEVNRLYESFFDFAELLRPYTDDKEVLKDFFSYLDLCFTLVISARGFSGEDFPTRDEAGYVPGLSVSASDLGELLLSGRLAAKESGLSEEANEQIENAYFHIESRRKRGINKDFLSRFDIAATKFGLNDFERFAMLLALSVEYDRKYEAIYTYLHNNSSDYCPTKWLAVKLYGYLFGNDGSYAGLLSGESPLCRFMCDDRQKRRDRGESAQRLTLSPRLSSYLLGSNEIDASLKEYCRIYPGFVRSENVPVRKQERDFIRDIFISKAFKDKIRFATTDVDSTISEILSSLKEIRNQLSEIRNLL